MTRTRAAVLSLLVAPLVALAALVAGVGPASAHAGLTGSDPADGATLAAAPGTVSFTFNEDIREPAFVVVTAAGQRVAEGQARVDANVVTARVDDGAPAGRWTAAYRVVSVDGHAVTGEIAFEVEQAAPSASASATPSPGADASASPGTSAESTQGAATSGDDDGLWPPHTEHVVLAAVLLAAAAALLLWSRRRAR